jgi:fumarate hydratase class II
LSKSFRIEHDTMGSVEVPASAYYGAQTKRAIENFQISGQLFPRKFIRALGIVKAAATEANMQLGKAREEKRTIRKAFRETK